MLAHVYLKKVKENILLIDCSFKITNVVDSMLLMTSAIPRPLSLYEKFTCKGRWEGENGQEVLRLFPTYGPLTSLALCYQSLACHVHFVLASMQKMKHLRRKNGHLLKLSLIESINPFLAS